MAIGKGTGTSPDVAVQSLPTTNITIKSAVFSMKQKLNGISEETGVSLFDH